VLARLDDYDLGGNPALDADAGVRDERGEPRVARGGVGVAIVLTAKRYEETGTRRYGAPENDPPLHPKVLRTGWVAIDAQRARLASLHNERGARRSTKRTGWVNPPSI